MTKVWNLCPQRILAAIVLTAFFVAFAGSDCRRANHRRRIDQWNRNRCQPGSCTHRNGDHDRCRYRRVHVYKTDSAGIYTAPFLIPGHYEVDAMAPNFGKVEEKGITLQVGQTLTINLTLKVSGATTTVEVSGDQRNPRHAEDRSFAGRRSEFGRKPSRECAQLVRLRAAHAQRYAGRQ